MKNKWIYIIAGVVLLALIGAFTIYFFSTADYVATVAGEKVTKAEYNFVLFNVKNSMLSENKDKLPDAAAVKGFWEGKPDGNKTSADVAKERALDSVKEMKIQLIKAKQNKVVLDKTQLDQIKTSLDEQEKQAGGKASAEQAFLLQFGVNRAQFEEVYIEFMTASKFAQAEIAKIQATDEDAKKAYEADKDSLDKVTVRHILFTTVDPAANNAPLPQDKQDAAKKLADEVYAKVKAGGDFAALAKQYSEDPGSKDKGGEYTFGKGEMVPQFEEWSYKAKPGDTGIVQSSFGYHVMLFEKRTTFEDVKDAALTAAKRVKYSAQLEEWKKDKQYNVITNPKVYNAIKVE